MSDIPVLDDAPAALPKAKRAYVRRGSGTKTRRSYPRRKASDVAQVSAAAVVGAADRAEPARELNSDEGPRTRVSREARSVDTFNVPRHRKKPGWDYQWWTFRIMGQNVDGSNMASIYNGGWRAEKARDWPELVMPGTSPDDPVESEGQRLYSRPMSLTHEAKDEDYRAAVQQQRDRMQGAFEGRSGEGALSDIKGVKAHGLQLDIEGEVGTHSQPAKR